VSSGLEATVVVPTRDRPHLLALTLRSVLAQHAVDLEVVVVNDGDGNETAALVNGLGDSRVRLIRNTQARGVSGARNCGIAAARRQWIAVCDDDDLWSPIKLSTQLAAVTDAGAAWVYGGEVMVDENLHVLSGHPPPMPGEVICNLPTHNAVPAGASNVVVHIDALTRAGRFDPALRTSEDWDLWLRLARTAGYPAWVRRPLVALRVHGQMASRRADWMLRDIEVIASRYGVPVDRARHLRWAGWMALQDGRRLAAAQYYARSVGRGDWRSVARAIVALLEPRVARRRTVATGDPWIREAETWLKVLRLSQAA